MNLRPLFILGPTGCGKSSVSVELAEMLGNAEIVSADAYQIYCGMPILTAAPSDEELARVPHHLIAELPLCEPNDAARHARAAQACIEDIQSRGKRPIVTGGSGLYVKFISHGISEAPPSSAALRAELEALTSEELIAQFNELDAEGVALTPCDNRRYLVRNLEMVMLSGKPLSYWRSNWNQQPAGLGFSLVREHDDIEARIAKRAQEMFHVGVLDEVRALEKQKLSATVEKTLGLSLLREAISQHVEPAIWVENLRLITRQYAKRQRTWLRREDWLEAFHVAPEQGAQEIALRLFNQLSAESL